MDVLKRPPLFAYLFVNEITNNYGGFVKQTAFKPETKGRKTDGR